MPARSVVITSIVVLAVLLTVALIVRAGDAFGVERSITIGPGVTLRTSVPKPVVFILEHTAPDGTTSQLGWGIMSNQRQNVFAGINLPTTGSLTIRWGIDKALGYNAGGGLAVVPSQGVMAMPSPPSMSYALMDLPGQTASVSGSTSLQLGRTYEGRFDRRGLTITSSAPAGAATPIPAPPPPPPTPPMVKSDPPVGTPAPR